MSRISPNPTISQVVRTWDVQPGMSYSVVEDVDGRVWIEESCPVGKHYWTLAQAANIAGGARTQRILDEALTLACEHSSLDKMPKLPHYEAPRAPVRQRRTASTPDRRLAGV